MQLGACVTRGLGLWQYQKRKRHYKGNPWHIVPDCPAPSKASGEHAPHQRTNTIGNGDCSSNVYIIFAALLESSDITGNNLSESIAFGRKSAGFVDYAQGIGDKQSAATETTQGARSKQCRAVLRESGQEIPKGQETQGTQKQFFPTKYITEPPVDELSTCAGDQKTGWHP